MAERLWLPLLQVWDRSGNTQKQRFVPKSSFGKYLQETVLLREQGEAGLAAEEL